LEERRNEKDATASDESPGRGVQEAGMEMQRIRFPCMPTGYLPAMFRSVWGASAAEAGTQRATLDVPAEMTLSGDATGISGAKPPAQDGKQTSIACRPINFPFRSINCFTVDFSWNPTAISGLIVGMVEFAYISNASVIMSTNFNSRPLVQRCRTWPGSRIMHAWTEDCQEELTLVLSCPETIKWEGDRILFS
jgi:hypothetical protein